MSVSQTTLTFEKAFRGKYTTLSSKIDTSHGLWNQLLDRDVLTSQQISTCQHSPIEDERVSKLLDLLKKRDNSLFPNFCDALVATGQRHVVDYLLSEVEYSSTSFPVVAGTQASFAAGTQVSFAVPPPPKMEVPLHGSFRDAFRNVRSVLVDRLDVSHGLIDILCRDNILTEQHASDIRACRTEIDKANRLLELLERRDDAMFPRFCEALYEARQQGVVEDILRPNLAAGPVDGKPGLFPVGASAATTNLRHGAAAETGRSRHSHPHPAPVMHRPRMELPKDVSIIPHRCLRNLESLTEGGFGIVYRAEHEDWGTVAYKELKTSVIRPESRLAKDLIHEGQMHKLRHPNIVMLLAVIFEAQHYGVLFEYVIYGGLDCFVEDYQVDWPLKLHIAQGVVRGMNYLHTKDPAVVHGDLKVQNVLIGDAYVAKICDFGLAKWRNYSTTKTNSRSQRGTVTHIAPENWRDINVHRTLKFDLYGFGIMLWELLTEQIPFGGDAPAGQIQAAVVMGQRPNLQEIKGPEHFEVFARTCIAKCWDPEPEQRPTFGELNAQFEDMLRRNEDVVKAAISSVNLQTSQLPMDAE